MVHMTKSIARKTLTTAQFFLDKAVLSSSMKERRELEHYLEAAIVFGRSVTFHLQKEFSNRTGFNEWYEEKRSQMAKDPIFGFFLDKRNYILKEGPIQIQKSTNITVSDSINLSGYVQVRVIRAKSWYRRSPKIWFDDIKAAIIQPFHKWCHHRKQTKRRKQRLKTTHSEIQELLHFEEVEWSDRSAIDVLQEYLNKQKILVEEAESRLITGIYS